MTADEELSDQDWAVWRDFMSMSGQLSRELDRRLQADAGISHADYSVLVVLQQASDHQLRTGELAELLAWEKSRVSHQVARMEARALVSRRECDTDGRGTWIEPTAEGRRVLLGAMRNHNPVSTIVSVPCVITTGPSASCSSMRSATSNARPSATRRSTCSIG